MCWLGEVCGRVPPCHRPTCSRFQLTLHRLSSSSSSSSFSSLFIRLLILCILSFPSSRFCFALVFAHWRATRDWQSNPFVSHLSSWVLLDSAWASFLFEPVSSYFYFFFFLRKKKFFYIIVFYFTICFAWCAIARPKASVGSSPASTLRSTTTTTAAADFLGAISFICSDASGILLLSVIDVLHCV